MDNREIMQRYGVVSAARTTVQETWDVIEEFVTPYRGRFFRDQRDEHSIEWRDRQVWDSTAIMAHQNLSASLHGSLTSPSIRWFDLRFRDDVMNKDKAASNWLQEASEAVYFELQDSNFNLEINECYQDICGYGTGVVTQEMADPVPGLEDWNGMDFASVPLKEAYFEEDHKARVRYFYRHLTWTAGQIITKFGKENVPQSILDLDEKGVSERQGVMFCIFPRDEKPGEIGQVLAPKRRPYGYKYLLMSDQSSLGEEGGYYEMPAFIPRWRKTSESVWGNSPAHFALSDILTLNQWVEIFTERAEKETDPPVLAEERAIITDLDISARGLTVVRNIDGVKFWDQPGNLSITLEGLQMYRSAVRNYFFEDQINYPDAQAQPMTATEAQIRYELMQRLLGPTLGRLQNDLLNPIVSRTFNMLARAKQLGDIPEIVQESQPTMDIEYVGALARAQRVDQAAAIERWLANVANIAQAAPEIMDVVDWTAAGRQMGRQLNIDPELMNDEKEVKALQVKREAQKQRMIESEQQAREGEAAESMGKGREAQAQANNLEAVQ